MTTASIVAGVIVLLVLFGYLAYLYIDANKSYKGSKMEKVVLFIKQCKESDRLYRREQRKSRHSR